MIKIIKMWEKEHENYKSLLKNDYKKYITEISSDDMAASLECCIFLLALYDFTRASNILDLGSGVSSYALRLFKKFRMFDSNIVSVDTSEEWLNKSLNFCIENHVDGDNFITWDQFKNKDIKFDLIFLDIDYIKPRRQYLAPTFENFSKKGTFILCDDMHKSSICFHINAYLTAHNNFLKQYDVKKQTIDRFERFSTLIEVI
jgi:predicted O-methyltransferase YrrM